jgi:hypothetical protein
MENSFSLNNCRTGFLKNTRWFYALYRSSSRLSESLKKPSPYFAYVDFLPFHQRCVKCGEMFQKKLNVRCTGTVIQGIVTDPYWTSYFVKIEPSCTLCIETQLCQTYLCDAMQTSFVYAIPSTHQVKRGSKTPGLEFLNIQYRETMIWSTCK